MTRPKKILFGLLVSAALLGGAELALRASDLLPLRTEFIERGGRARFAGNDFGEEWPVAKPAGNFRVLIAGSSTSLGFPWGPRSTFGYRLQVMLEQALPGRKVEVIHAGQMSASSAEVRETVRNALHYRPDLVIVYSGQNVFLAGAGQPRSGTGRLREALKWSRLVRALGGITRGISDREYAEADIGLVYPEPERMTPARFNQALADYRHDLTAIARACRGARVPLVLSDMVYNLGDWPPNPLATPDRVAGAVRGRLLDNARRTREQFEQGRWTEAAALAQPDAAAGYAFAAYYLGWARLGQLPAGQALPGSGPEAELGRGEFLRAVSDEARTVVSHRASPEVNAVLREVAAAEGAWLLPAEREFFGEAVAPGFDLFEDQCHPNRRGQQLMAAALFRLLRSHGLPAPAAEWRTLPAWDEAAFRRERGLDDAFERRVSLTMAIFQGLKAELPDDSMEVRRLLRLAQDLYPVDPFPALLQTLVDAHYRRPTPAADLAGYYRRDPEAVARLVRDRLTTLVELRDGQLRVTVQPAPFLPPLRGMIRRNYFRGGRPEPAETPIPGATVMVYDLNAGGAVVAP